MHEDLHAAIEKIFKAAVAAGKKTGIFCTGGKQSKFYAEMGFQMISKYSKISLINWKKEVFPLESIRQ
jgi:2-keto-3-deoxy-L-rhamnonate aldolase RhmA